MLCAGFFRSLGVLEMVLVTAMAALSVREAPEVVSSCLFSLNLGMDGLRHRSSLDRTLAFYMVSFSVYKITMWSACVCFVSQVNLGP